jgi:hypothetical protein
MEKIPAREYARRHRMSLFEVIKRINSGELKGETIEENGVNVQYVLLDSADTPAPKEKESSTQPTGEERKEKESALFEKLFMELSQLRIEVARLRRTLEACCEKRDEEK